jgi:hypothetical protein
MPEGHDYDLITPERREPLEPPPGDRPVGVWIAGALLVVAAGIAIYIVFGGRTAAPPAVENAPPVEAIEAPAAPLGTEPDPIDVPPLGESDPVVRELIRALSTHPQIVSWLATDSLVRNFTTVVTNVVEGTTPRQHLERLQPKTEFRVIERGGNLYIDPATFTRYNALADAVASVDPAGAAKVYATLKPRIQEAYGELGFPDTPFDRTLERAIVLLLNTPVPPDVVRVETKGTGIGYGFVDDELETLSGSQKQLIRMGPRNVRIIQRALRNVASALGIPAERLPAPQVP